MRKAFAVSMLFVVVGGCGAFISAAADENDAEVWIREERQDEREVEEVVDMTMIFPSRWEYRTETLIEEAEDKWTAR